MSLVFTDRKGLRWGFLNSQNKVSSEKAGRINGISLAQIQRKLGILTRSEIAQLFSEIVPVIQQPALEVAHNRYTSTRRYTCRV